MAHTDTTRAGDVVDTVTGIVDSAFRALDALGERVRELYRTRGPLPPAGALGELRPVVWDILDNHPLLAGAGLITGPGAVAGAELGAEWWNAPDGAEPSRLRLDLDRGSPSFFDVTRQPWFAVPRDTGAEHLTGPYVDYVCTEEYSLTLSAPAYHGDRFLGVVGADIYVRSLERALLPALRAVGGDGTDAVLVNAQGRVIASNSLRLGTGSMVREPRLAGALAGGAPDAGPFTLHRCGRHPITLLTR